MANLREFRAQKQAEIAMVQSEIKKRNKRFYLIVGMVIALAGIAFFGARQYDKAKIEKLYQEYISSSGERYDELSADSLLLQYKDSATLYETNSLFNSNARTIDYGTYCEKDGLILETTKDGLLLTKDNKPAKIAEQTSYNGILGGYVYFRDDSDLGIYKYDVATGEKLRLNDDSAGEVIVSNDGVFFINLSKDNHIYKFDGSKEIEFVAEKTKAFAIVGKSIMFLTQKNILKSMAFDSTTPTTIQDKIENFSFANKVIVENNGKLIEFSIYGNDNRILYDGDATLITANENAVIFVENKKLKVLDKKTLAVEDYDSGDLDIYKSANLNESEIKIIGFKRSSGSDFKIQYLTVQRQEAPLYANR
jgi:hypothetical protein